VLNLFNLYFAKLELETGERHLMKTIFTCGRWDFRGVNHFEKYKAVEEHKKTRTEQNSAKFVGWLMSWLDYVRAGTSEFDE
jgi:hypothetical protein